MRLRPMEKCCTTQWVYDLPQGPLDAGTKKTLESQIKTAQNARGNLLICMADKKQALVMVELGFKKLAKYPSDAQDRHGDWIYIMALGHTKLEPKAYKPAAGGRL